MFTALTTSISRADEPSSEPAASPPAASAPPESAPSAQESPPSTPTESPPATSGGGSSKEGSEFKCTDGYDPDSDASLHPANQHPKVRMQINAEAQKAHEEALAEKARAAAEAKEKEAKEAALSGKDEKKENKDQAKNPSKENEKKDTAEKEKEKNKKDDVAKSDGAAKSAKASEEKANYSPIKEALYLMSEHKYEQSAAVLNGVIAKNANNIDARYLLAVTYVSMRKYQEATEQYNKVISIAPSSRQAELAQAGLKKIAR